MIARISVVAAIAALAAAPGAAAQTAATIAGPGFTKTIDAADIDRWARHSQRIGENAGRAGALSSLIYVAWLEGEAAERGIRVTNADVAEELREIRAGLGHETQAEYRRYVRTELYMSMAEHRKQVRRGMLEVRIRNLITEPAARSVTPEQIEAYVQANPRTEPERRRVRLINARSRAAAKRAFAKIRRGLTLKTAHRRYSDTPGLTVTVIDEPTRTRAHKAIFEAKPNRLTRYGTTVFKVIRITPARPAPLEEQRAQAWEILTTQAQQQAYEAFRHAHRAKWLPRTTFAPAFADHPDCPNNPPTGE